MVIQDTQDTIGYPLDHDKDHSKHSVDVRCFVCLSENDKRNADRGEQKSEERAVNIGMDAEQRNREDC